jgi:hypothetical protein
MIVLFYISALKMNILQEMLSIDREMRHEHHLPLISMRKHKGLPCIEMVYRALLLPDHVAHLPCTGDEDLYDLFTCLIKDRGLSMSNDGDRVVEIIEGSPYSDGVTPLLCLFIDK